jgi:hypothetical protein
MPQPLFTDADGVIDTEYLLHRSETEAIQAIAATDARAEAVHQQLCLLYAGRAVAGLMAQPSIPPAGGRST